MTWNPESPNHVEHVDLNATIASRSTSDQGMGSKFRSSDGNTYGDWQFPETAPLIFPALDKLASQTGEDAEKKQGKMAKSKNFVANYWDKRATAEYVCFIPFRFEFVTDLKCFSGRQKSQQHARQRAPSKILLPLRRPQQRRLLRLARRLRIRRPSRPIPQFPGYNW